MKAVAAAIIKKNGKFLIAKRKAGGVVGGKWEFPGGKIEKNESPKAALKRELKEEFDIDVKIGGFFNDHIQRYEKEKVKVFAYIIESCGNNFKLNDHDEIRWISKAEMKKFDFVGNDKPIVKKLAYES